MPLIYERWCLLQIISVLINSFRFIPKDGWKKDLVNTIKSDGKNYGKNVEIKFFNPDAKRNILLTYEKNLIMEKDLTLLLISIGSKKVTLRINHLSESVLFWMQNFMTKPLLKNSVD